MTEQELRLHSLEKALYEIADHFEDVMGYMAEAKGMTFKNGVEGIPTIARARALLKGTKHELGQLPREDSK